MTFRDWKYWLKSLPWNLRWFVILVLIRPVVDNFYYLKNISPFLSPLYIVGIATPILALYAIISLKRRDSSIFDFLFGFWSILVFLSLLFMFIADPLSVTFLEYFLKLSMPIYLFFFLRLLIRSARDLDGVLQTFLYSSLFVVAVFLFELVVNPIKVQKTRDLERIQGYYGDVMNYAIYLTQGFLIMCYFYFRKRNIESVFTRNRNLILTVILCVAMLFKISHTASYAVFLSILLLFIVFNLKTNKTAGFVLVIVIAAAGYFFGGEAIEKNVAPLLKTDIAVYEGKKSNERLLHGRVGRWKMMLEQYSEFPVTTQFVGMPSTMEPSYAEVSTGAHNDFVRILFFTGYIGLLIYVLTFFAYFNRLKYLDPDHHFLALGSVMILLLYSISTCPTLYAPMLYILYAVLCYVALPKSVLAKSV
ncbi:MAG: O-antigen ligase family protein [Bacteroidetes bacterium]|nr:O-antigen ligase family protein [Bacteroidota bacterium]